MLKELRAQGDVSKTLLLLGGPEDFLLPPGTEEQTADDLASPLFKAFSGFDFDLHVLKKHESEWLTANSGQGAPQPPFVALASEPQSLVIDKEGISFGVIVFPELPPEERRPDEDMIESIVEAAHALQSQVDVIVGMSPWGKRGERYFLDETENVLHILLGGGPGPSENGDLTEDDHTLWIRSFTKGKYLHVVTIFALPEAGSPWIEGQHYRAAALALEEKIIEQPEVRALFPKAN